MTAPTRKPQVEQEPGTAVVLRKKRDDLKAELERFGPSFAKVLPKHLTAERVVTLALVAATKNPAILDCTPESIALALMQVSMWGLDIGRTAHLVPFKGKVVAIADWKGLVELMLRSGHVKDVKARPVYSNERFVEKSGSQEFIEHERIWDESKRGELTAFYAIAFLKSGRATWEVMTKAEVDRIRQKSMNRDGEAWTNHYVEMGKKTAIRRLAKRIPQSAEIVQVLEAEDLADAGQLPPHITSLLAPSQPSPLAGPSKPLAGQSNGFQYEDDDGVRATDDPGNPGNGKAANAAITETDANGIVGALASKLRELLGVPEVPESVRTNVKKAISLMAGKPEYADWLRATIADVEDITTKVQRYRATHPGEADSLFDRQIGRPE